MEESASISREKLIAVPDLNRRMIVCVILVQVNDALIFRFVDIKEELRSQIFQHAIFQYLIMTYKTC